MKRQITQFDNGRTNATVATPTCSSCCCCCCCLTTTLASSTILAARINRDARKKKVKDPVGLTILAALFLPAIALATYLITYAINEAFGHCTTQVVDGSISGETYQLCSQPANTLFVALPIGLIVSVLILRYLYTRVKMKRPLTRAVIVTVVVGLAFVVEAIGGALLILSGSGGVIYLFLVPVLCGAAWAFYDQRVAHLSASSRPSKNRWLTP